MRGIQWKTAAVASLVVLATSAGAGGAEVLGKTEGPLDAMDVRKSECSLGNLVAEAARTAMRAEAALVQASQLRPVEIPKGDLTREVVLGALLYPDENVVLVELSGKQVRDALERGLSMLPNPNTGFLQVSGLHVTYKSEDPPGQRVVEVKLSGAALSPTKMYKVAMPASLAKGALGYFRVFGDLQPKQGPQLGQAVADFVLAMRTISPQTGRLRDLSKASP